MEGSMPHLFFHCTGPGELLVDHHGTSVSNQSEARERAVLLAAEAILVNGRPPRFPSNEGKDLLETVRIVRTKVR